MLPKVLGTYGKNCTMQMESGHHESQVDKGGSINSYHEVVSQHKGTPISTPEFYNPYSRDPQKGTPNFGKL